MPTNQRPKIVYLLGTGATHAEKHLDCKLKNSGITPDGKLTNGLISSQVSQRVIKKLLEEKQEMLDRYGITSDSISTPWGDKDIDIELFISLLDKINSQTSSEDTRTLRKYYKKDICDNLIAGDRQISPRLLCSLIEFHNLIDCNEELMGFLTLNYDSVLENAFSITGNNFDYGIGGITMDTSKDFPFVPRNRYLLKMHGSFDWFLDSEVTNRIIVKSEGNPEAMQWIPPQVHKAYERYPFSEIHSKAKEILNRCDILRIIGCSLSPNDINLISLLFETQLDRRPNTYTIEFIGSEKTWKTIVKERLGALLNFKELFYNEDDWGKLGKNPGENRFLDWLYYKINKTQINDITSTSYLKDIPTWIEG